MSSTIIDTLGALMLGIFFNTFLYGLGVYQYSAYLSSNTFRDALWIKLTVAALFAIDAFHSISLIYLAWNFLIVGFANPLLLLGTGTLPTWPWPSTVIVTACSALLTHLFLAYRTLRLTNTYLFVGLLTLSVASFASGIACGVKVFGIKTTLDQSKIFVILAVWLSLETAVDLSISASLIWSLSRSRTGFHQSNTIIKRLLRTSIQTGLFTSICSMLALTLLISMPQSLWYTVFGFPISRFYSNTLLDTLLCREGVRGILNQTDNTSTSVQLSVRKEIRTSIRVDHINHEGMEPLSTLHRNSTITVDQKISDSVKI